MKFPIPKFLTDGREWMIRIRNPFVVVRILPGEAIVFWEDDISEHKLKKTLSALEDLYRLIRGDTQRPTFSYKATKIPPELPSWLLLNGKEFAGIFTGALWTSSPRAIVRLRTPEGIPSGLAWLKEQGDEPFLLSNLKHIPLPSEKS